MPVTTQSIFLVTSIANTLVMEHTLGILLTHGKRWPIVLTTLVLTIPAKLSGIVTIAVDATLLVCTGFLKGITRTSPAYERESSVSLTSITGVSTVAIRAQIRFRVIVMRLRTATRLTSPKLRQGLRRVLGQCALEYTYI